IRNDRMARRDRRRPAPRKRLVGAARRGGNSKSAPPKARFTVDSVKNTRPREDSAYQSMIEIRPATRRLMRRITRFLMRACARVALVFTVLFAGLGLAGCASIDELKDAISGWFATGKSLHRQEDLNAVPDATHRNGSEGMPRQEASKASKKKDMSAHTLQRQEIVNLPKKPPLSASAEAVRPQAAAPSQPAPSQLRTPFPEAPAPGSFSR